MDEAAFNFLRPIEGLGLPADWAEFRTLAAGSGEAEWRDGAQRLEVLRPAVSSAGELPPDLADLAALLLERWQHDRDPHLELDALRWALALQRWTLVDESWLNDLRRNAREGDPAVLLLLAGLPVEARRVNPILTWAWAAARSYAIEPSQREQELVRLLLSDAVALHARWREAPNVDAAIAAATIWMLAQRFLPSTPATAAQDAAWDTQNQVAAHIEEQRREQRPPNPLVEAVFHAGSSRIALARADLHASIAEADFALALEPETARGLVHGTRNLALELAGFAGEPGSPARHLSAPAAYRIGLGAQDALAELIAKALAALRRLDRPACLAAQAELDPLPSGAPSWTVVTHVQQLAGAVWGDADSVLTRTDATVARYSVISLEHRGRLGSALLGRGRAALLSRLGSHRAAREALAGLPRQWARAPLACVELWSGDPEAAARAATEGIHDPATTQFDRVTLLVVRAAAGGGGDTAAAARTAVAACLDHDLWLPLAMVPAEASRRVLAAAASGPDPVTIPESVARRLEELAAGPENPPGAVSLTRREQVLLPLLAGQETVPEIAAALHVSANTVRKQVVTLRAKFGAGTRGELVRRARELGLLE